MGGDRLSGVRHYFLGVADRLCWICNVGDEQTAKSEKADGVDASSDTAENGR